MVITTVVPGLHSDCLKILSDNNNKIILSVLHSQLCRLSHHCTAVKQCMSFSTALPPLRSLWRSPWKAFLRLSSSAAELKRFCPTHIKELFFAKSDWLGPLGYVLPLSVTLSTSYCHLRDLLVAQKVEQLFSPALLAFCWLFSVHFRSWVCCRALDCVRWPLLCSSRSWLSPCWFLHLASAAKAAPASSTTPPGILGIFTSLCDLFPKRRPVKKDLSLPSFHTALGDQSHMGFFPYFT